MCCLYFKTGCLLMKRLKLILIVDTRIKLFITAMSVLHFELTQVSNKITMEV